MRALGEPIAAAVLAVGWQALLVGATAWLALRGTPSPRARHAIALGGLAALVALGALSFARALAAAPPRAGVPGPVPPLTLDDAIALGWAAGAALMLGRLLHAWARARALVRAGRPAPPALLARVERLARHVGLGRRVRVLLTDRLGAPAVVGFLRPAVLVPPAVLLGLDPAALEAVLAHELDHLRAHDWLVEIAVELAEALLFFHPVAWWLGRTVRREREHRCDDAAARLVGDASRYARALVALAEQGGPTPRLLPSIRGGELMSRVERLVLPRPAPSRAAAALAAAAGALTIVVVSACAAPAEAPGPTGAAIEARGIPWLPPGVRRHDGAIEAAARAHGVDADLLRIVALVESFGDEHATSGLGARGLLQVMPRTAVRIARERGLPAPSPEALYDPATNLDLGAWYLARQLDDFAVADPDRAVESAAAAYNAGPRAARAWLEGAAPLPLETERYKALVVSLWRERGAPRSPTLEALEARRAARSR